MTATSQALAQVTHCLNTYIIQFAEAAGQPHVHVHIVPQMADQPDHRRGPRIFGYLGVPESDRVPADEMDRIAADVRAFLTTAYPHSERGSES